MTVTGTVLSVDVERYGDTLTADTAATDHVLHVEDIVDFADEDDFAAGPQWLTVGGSAPMQYVSVDDDNDTVTLATPVGAVYEDGEPVRMWDPSAGAEVISHVAWIELDEADDNDAPIPAEVRHDEVIYFGLDNMAGLIGAQVSIEQDDDDGEAWHVAEVIGRKPAVASEYVSIPRGRALIASETLTHATTTVLAVAVGEFDEAFSSPEFSRHASGLLYKGPPVVVQVAASGRWLANSTGYRRLTLTTTAAGDSASITDQADAAQNGVRTDQAIAGIFSISDGDVLEVRGWQNSGANLDVTNVDLRAVVVGYL